MCSQKTLFRFCFQKLHILNFFQDWNLDRFLCNFIHIRYLTTPLPGPRFSGCMVAVKLESEVDHSVLYLGGQSIVYDVSTNSNEVFQLITNDMSGWQPRTDMTMPNGKIWFSAVAYKIWKNALFQTWKKVKYKNIESYL